MVVLDWPWFLVEPASGEWSMGFVNATKKRISELSQLGMYTLLDVHVDNFKPLFASYAARCEHQLRYVTQTLGAMKVLVRGHENA